MNTDIHDYCPPALPAKGYAIEHDSLNAGPVPSAISVITRWPEPNRWCPRYLDSENPGIMITATNIVSSARYFDREEIRKRENYETQIH